MTGVVLTPKLGHRVCLGVEDNTHILLNTTFIFFNVWQEDAAG